MAAPTREELEQADAALAKAGYDENERLSVLLQLQEAQVPGVPGFMQPFESPATKGGRELQGVAQAIVPASTAALGGSLTRYGLSKMAPKLLQYAGPELSAIGEGTGAFLGGLATGQTPQQAGEGALLSGVAGGLTERGVQETGRAFARAGKVTPRTMRETLQQGGFKRLGTTMSGIGEEAYINEAEALRQMAQKARVDKSPGRLAAQRQMREFDAANTQTVTERGPLTPEGQSLVKAQRQAGLLADEAENLGHPDAAKMRAYSDLLQSESPTYTSVNRRVGGIDFSPVKQRILRLVDNRATDPGRIRVNQQLRDLADRLPDRGTMADLDFHIREHTEPIKGQVQNLEASLPTGIQQKVVAGMRQYRNQLLPEAKQNFARASNYLKATKRIRAMLVDKNGDLRTQAEGIWRQIPRNKVILRSFEEYDRVHGTQIAPKALELARKANWTPGDGATALGMIDASVGWFGRAAATTSRGIGKGLVSAAIPAGRSAAAAAAFYNAMNNP